MTDKMNNTDFFNDHRADALKLIAESVYPGAEVITKVCHWQDDKIVALYDDNRNFTGKEYNPCADTTEGKAQLLDLIMIFKGKVDEMIDSPSVTLENEAHTMYILFNALESPEATCIDYLDMIRKV